MRIIAIVALILALACATGMAQFQLLGEHNAYTTKLNWTGPDSLRPYATDQGVRRVWVTKNLNKDGKDELLATDYSNGGRVHLFEMTAPNKLELVWSSPRLYSSNANSTPRWMRDGDLDGNGMREIIYPVGPRYTGEVAVFQYTGVRNHFGATPGVPDLILPAAQFVPTLGASSAMRMDREQGEVYDFDGDGKDELVMANQDGNVYVLGVQGDIGGFGSWGIEGGDPAVNPENKFSGGSWWHSVPADINGDGKKEIVNHYWNHYGFWSIIPNGPDSYRYPTPGRDSSTNVKAKTQFYHEYMPNDPTGDAVAYMGVAPVDIDGKGKQEIAGILYIDGGEALDYAVSLTSIAKGDTGLYVWKDSSQFGIIGQNLWTLAGKTTGSHWGIAAYDFDGDGKQELYIGGSADYNVIQMKYKGTGSILDKNNYTNTIVYSGDKARYHVLTMFDSLGAKHDTTFAESPFLSAIFAGGDLNGNGKKELAIAYQSIADSISYTWEHWDTTAIPKGWKIDSTKKLLNTNVIDIRVLEYQGATGFKEIGYTTIGPEDYKLEQNYPNPFNPSTEIHFSMPVDKRISLVVYDMLGQKVKTLIGDQDYKEGTHAITWDGTNDAGKSVATGSYVYTLTYGNFQKSQKMMLVR
jgi:hypothetical protein